MSSPQMFDAPIAESERQDPGAHGPSAAGGGRSHNAHAWMRDLWERYSAPLIIASLLGFAARGQAVFAPMYSIDGYSSINAPPAYGDMLAGGRIGMAALWWLDERMDFFGMPSAVAGHVFCVVLLAAMGIALAISLLKRPTGTEAFLFACLFSLHPFLTEFFSFSEITFDIVRALALAALGLTIALVGPARPWIMATAVVLIAAALSTYQLAAIFVGVTWLLALAANLSSAARLGSSAWASVRSNARSLAIMASGAALYIVVLIATSKLFKFSLNQRADITHLSAKERYDGVVLALTRTFHPDPGLIPSGASALMIALMVASTAIIVLPLIRSRRLISAVVVLAVVAVAIISACGFTVLSGTIWMVPRVLSPISVVLAGLVLLAWRAASRPVRLGLGCACALLCFSYVGASSHILSDQRRVNLWDAQQANRIVERFEQDPQFANMQTISVVGSFWTRTNPLKTIAGDMNISAFGAAWSKGEVLEEVTGYSFRAPTPEEMQTSEVYCKTVTPWPAAGAVHIAAAVGILCLPN